MKRKSAIDRFKKKKKRFARKTAKTYGVIFKKKKTKKSRKHK